METNNKNIVREMFKTQSVESITGNLRRMQTDIGKKSEDLRMLVGERYRDLIDAADTIGVMQTRSALISQKLTVLRMGCTNLPSVLNSSFSYEATEPLEDLGRGLSDDELEYAAKLKLMSEVPRRILLCLEEEKVVDALHLVLFQSAKLADMSAKRLTGNFHERKSILAFCKKRCRDISSSSEILALCFVARQVLTKSLCIDVVEKFLSLRLGLVETALDKGNDFLENVSITLQSLHQIFIDPEIYNESSKRVRTPFINVEDLGLSFNPKCVGEFNTWKVPVQDPPRVSQLSEIMHSNFLKPLKKLLWDNYGSRKYLVHQRLFSQMRDYKHATNSVLSSSTEDLMRIVLGTSTSIWTEVFGQVYQQKCWDIITERVSNQLLGLINDAFPKYIQYEAQNVDFVSYIWKDVVVPEETEHSHTKSKISIEDNTMKLKSYTPGVCMLCADLEQGLQELLSDYLCLDNDPALRQFFSTQMKTMFEEMIRDIGCRDLEGFDLFMARFSVAALDLCPTLWEILEKQDGSKVKQLLLSLNEECWNKWSQDFVGTLTEQFNEVALLKDSTSAAIAMSVGEVVKNEETGNIETTIRVPVTISHHLHSFLFSICLKLAGVGPQSIPKSVLHSFRLSVGKAVAEYYETFIQGSRENNPEFSAQLALQLIFDLRLVQWFHPDLGVTVETHMKILQGIIDPFDWNIVSPKMVINLKRFLFENHLTLGLLFSEESHGFIAQNLKTKQSRSLPIFRPTLGSGFPLLPV